MSVELSPQIAGDPATFSEVILGHQLWGKQREGLRAIATNSRVAIKACHSSSKTFLAAEAVLWWICTKPNAWAVTTAPVFDQVRLLLWSEIRKSAETLKKLLGKDAVELLQTELKLANGSHAVGLSTNEGVRFQGFHGDILIVLDEAPGVRAEIWEAIEGIRAGGKVCVLAIGNPTIPSGNFYNAFTRERDLWKTITISAFDTPNLQGTNLDRFLALPRGMSEDHEFFQYRPTPYLVTRRWVYEVLIKYGFDSAYFQSRVLAQFPTQAEDSLIPLAWIEQAKARIDEAKSKINQDSELMAGIDVAGTGKNKTVVYLRSGQVILGKISIQGKDSRPEVARFLAPYKTRLSSVAIDVIGEGDYFSRHFEDLGYPVNRVNVGVPSLEPEKFKNLRSELYWTLRERFRDGDIAGDFDEDTIAQLSAIKVRTNSRGQIELESKEDMLKRGIESPDDADALVLAFSVPKTGVENWLSWMRDQAIKATQPKTNSSPEPDLGSLSAEDRLKYQSDSNATLRAYLAAKGNITEDRICISCHREVDDNFIDVGGRRMHPICFERANYGGKQF